MKIGKMEQVASLSSDIQDLCKSPREGEKPETKLIEMLVVIAKGTRYWKDVEVAVNAYENYQRDQSERLKTAYRPKKLPWRV
ncbi:hypothetical protein GCM10007416_22960 [Kroppenstedtia guangzhouensis]|jgi:hypothetical protein|uniref:Uncharacterized protein n=1 Tax=Kroppenstedtia guangzhouensis TaxID=1274356 RepID=A0ABQ1GSF4_9BACL|nr:hypothetical protein [Kroppenstedtia guangzhouensis]GGA49227.1 hypothetical protein GCM10007416_22960 [Kroppenstedtia guangzhouensis]